MQSFSRCIHFLKASWYADLGTVIRYWWMADPSACRHWYFRPARNAFNFANKKEITWDKVWGIRGVRQNRYFFFLQKRRNYCGGMSFFKIRWTVESDMPTFRAISRTVNLASPSMISFILETISLRDADFGLPDFGAFLMDSTPDSNFFFHRRTVS